MKRPIIILMLASTYSLAAVDYQESPFILDSSLFENPQISHDQPTNNFLESAAPLIADCGYECSEESTIENKKVLTQSLNAIIISPEGVEEHVKRNANGVEFYRVMQNSSPKAKKKLEKALSGYLGKPLTFEKLQQMRQIVANWYINQGYSLVVVTVPEQELRYNTVVIMVTEAKIGEVSVTGNYWYSKEYYLRNVQVEEGECCSTRNLSRNLQYLNHNPDRQVEAIFKQGSEPGTTDVELLVRDEKPIRLYVGADNTGFEATDYSRLFAGINWTNFLTLDQVISFQYTASPDFDKFQAYMVSYTAPLPWKDLLVLFGGYSLIHAEDDLLARVQKGQSWQFSGRYVMPLCPQDCWLQEAKCGFDWKRTNNDFIIGEDSFSTGFVTIFQLMGTYNTSYTWGRNYVAGEIDGYLQPWDFGESMTSTQYNKLRENAQTQYFYTHIDGMYRWQHTNGMQVIAKIRSQIATGALIPTEQFGLGGINCIRGYVDRCVNVDNALVGNFEVYTPSYSLFRLFRHNTTIRDSLQVLLFLDMGGGWLYNQNFKEEPSYFLAGMGPGLRYNVNGWLATRLDVGVRLTGVPATSTSSDVARFYFSVIGSY